MVINLIKKRDSDIFFTNYIPKNVLSFFNIIKMENIKNLLFIS